LRVRAFFAGPFALQRTGLAFAFFAAFLPVFFFLLETHFCGFFFGLGFGLITGFEAGWKFPMPLYVALAGVANTGGVAGAPWHPVPVHCVGTAAWDTPTRAS
jgi:hypothetical protein